MIASKDKEIEHYLKGLSDFQREIVLAIREAVLSAGKEMKEGMKWSSIAFYNKKNICGFRVAKAHITLLFMEGANLIDPRSLLEGTGRKARTYKVTNVKDIDVVGLKGLVKESLKNGL